MSKIDMQKIIVNFLPIILLFLLVSYTPEFAKFSHTILGKAFAIIIIIFYVKIDIYMGLLVCALVILYYQSDYVESFNNMLKEGFENEEEETDNDHYNDINMNNNEYDINTKEEEEKKYNTEEDTTNMDDVPIDYPEGFENIHDAYPLEITNSETNDEHDKARDNFRKMYCEKGHLMHKNQIVKPEMAEHVFPEIKQSDFHKCNICDTSCKFDITKIDKQMSIENDLLKPKSSNEMFDKVWTNMKKSVEGII
jgi:hypothetical protein